MKTRARNLLLCILASAAFGCGDNAGDTPSDAPGAADAGTVTPTSVALTTDGHLADGTGRTLYFLGKDIAKSNSTACMGACLTQWRVFDMPTPIVGENLAAADFGRFLRPDTNSYQTTWRGRPLYLYVGDTAPGMTAGEGTAGVWFVARTYNWFLGLSAGAATPPTPMGAAMGAPFFTNGAGLTVYMFKSDTRAVGGGSPTSACTGACLNNWKPWEAPADLGKVILPSTVHDVASFPNPSTGKPQFTFQGWPLYFYAPTAPNSTPDANPGDVGGNGILDLWFTVNPAWDGTP